MVLAHHLHVCVPIGHDGRLVPVEHMFQFFLGGCQDDICVGIGRAVKTKEVAGIRLCGV